MRTRCRFIAALLVGLFMAGVAPWSALAQDTSRPVQMLRLTGEVGRSTSFDMPALRALPQQRVEVGGKAYEGVDLWDIVSAGKPLPPAGLRNPMLSMVVIARAADGYQALFSLAEIDPAMGARQVLVAYGMDGKPLPESSGPFRLVVVGDRKPSRAVFGLVELELRGLK